MTSAKCPNCGANIQVSNDSRECFCSYCGSKIQIQEAANRAVKIDKSDDYKNFLRLAKENAEIGLFNDAVTYIDKSLEIQPDSAYVWMLKAYYSAGCENVDDCNENAIDFNIDFFSENTTIIGFGQKAIKLASSEDEVRYYTTKVYQLFLAVAKESLVRTYELASDMQWLNDRYIQLKEIYSMVQLTTNGQQEHERMLSIEDSGNINILASSLGDAVEFVKAVPKEFIIAKYYSLIKDIANQYLKCVKKIGKRLSVYNMHWSYDYIKRNNEAMTFINSYLPENERHTIVEINNDSQMSEINNDSQISSTKADIEHDLMIILVFLISIIMIVFVILALS